MEKDMKRIAVVLAVLALSACSVQEADNGDMLPQGELIGTIEYARLYKFDDAAAGNVCYVTYRSGDTAISCVPARYER
ncbi:lytic conversion lipoprotein [Stenotrophomonas phage StenR_269]|nr:lytic conversion lipoprotein [Stenotrophomonas phage StenR_269]